MKIPYFKAKIEGKEDSPFVEGFYFEIPSTTYAFLEGYKYSRVRSVPFLVSYQSLDWGLPCTPVFYGPIDKKSLTLLGYVETENESYDPCKWLELAKEKF